ncbi:hypothetical protein [Actinomycetospora cinnamomea]|uniref:Uncharacterized protein n=1 Tax=Actinomycetospora cinnamomea TaxID=663609 RepID=A0A2U1F9B4_9PSEU|nr:hypothetical protein [Actinomycetospora cinnamomea]PVZ08560.1 hypothetical protein C8D89_108157 [Actinomycetospora cinnamomea]
MSDDGTVPDSGMQTGSDGGEPGESTVGPADREEIAALEAEPPGEDVGSAVEDDPRVAQAAADDAPLPDQAAAGPSPDGEDPAFLGPD